LVVKFPGFSISDFIVAQKSLFDVSLAAFLTLRARALRGNCERHYKLYCKVAFGIFLVYYKVELCCRGAVKRESHEGTTSQHYNLRFTMKLKGKTCFFTMNQLTVILVFFSSISSLFIASIARCSFSISSFHFEIYFPLLVIVQRWPNSVNIWKIVPLTR
jgi:hypothetical protein